MLIDFPHIIMIAFIGVNAASVVYVLLAVKSVHAFSSSSATPAGGFQPEVTIMKPVCGLDTDLYENLRSFCLQDYPGYQIVYGVRDPDDAAIAVIRRLIAEFPRLDMELVVNENALGSNLKVGNLNNMYAAAKHRYLVIADADTRVEPHYLSAIIAPLEDQGVGVVTCLYRGTPAGGLASLLAGMFINEIFLPSVLVSAGIREMRFAMGATMVVRREMLDKMGGFGRLADNIADDYLLGSLAAEHGYRVVLSNYVVENIVFEKNFPAMLGHELRWARTIRSMEPVGHAFSVVMYIVPTALIAALAVGLATGLWLWAAAIIGLAVGLRALMHFAVHGMLGLKPRLLPLALGPVRDVLGFMIWGASFLSRRVDWRGNAFRIEKGGLMTMVERP